MIVLFRCFVFFILFLPTVQSFGQIKDNIIWASIKLDKELSSKSSLYIAPILRLNEDISSYQNTSIDIAFKYNLSAHWHIQLLSRTWFIPDQPRRQFIWMDLGYNDSINKYQIASHIRFHLALDINERDDPDYIRWKSTITFPGIGPIHPIAAIEPWFRINDQMQLQRMRYEPGLKIKIAKETKLSLIYRRENTANLIPNNRFNMYIITLAFNT